MDITAQLVKQLRDKTGAGMMDCKRALLETSGDLTAAEEHLRTKGLLEAARKSTRAAADGLVAVTVSDDRKTAAIVEVNSETDFVARNEEFQDLVSTIALEAMNSEDVLNATTKSGDSISSAINRLIARIGENITYRRSQILRVKDGVVAAYVHSAVNQNMGKIAVLVALEATCSEQCQCKHATSHEKLAEFGRKLAMHIAAANPSFLCPKCVPQDVIDKEKAIVIAQARSLGKPENIAEKMAEGRLKKFFEERVLLEQVYVIDGKTKISDVLGSVSKECGCDLEISGYIKYVLGEGIEREEKNFADEVSSFLK
jgi:elongation factor Ts